MKRFLWMWAAVLLVIAACTSQPTFDPTMMSTPVSDLPVSMVGDGPQISETTPVPAEVIDAADAEYLLLSNVYERATVSVVNIEASVVAHEGAISDVSRGSGFIYDNEGHIVTNAHVVRNAESIYVTFNNGYITTATLIGTDSYSNLAVIKVDVDANPRLSATFRIQSIPNLMIVKNRTIIFNQPGALPEPALRDLIQQAIALEVPPPEDAQKPQA